MRIVVFTGDENNGGIQQVVYTITRTAMQMGHEVALYMPDLEKVKIADDLQGVVKRYRKADSVFPKNAAARSVADGINACKPEIVIFPEDCIMSMQVLGCLDRSIRRCFFIHDVRMHPSRLNLRRRLVAILAQEYRKYGLKHTGKVCLLSENSYNLFAQRYQAYGSKAMLCKLGAHPPIAEPKELPELAALEAQKPFYLFFGRIDRYKGIENLLTAYGKASQEQPLPKLVIAGNGSYSEAEAQLVSSIPNVISVNRFIENGEMLWLLKNSMCVVIPYIEASQSGVIPLAYYCGKPVIASNIPGLKETVAPGRTGVLANDVNEMAAALRTMCTAEACERMKDHCLAYYESEMSWRKGIEKLIDQIGAMHGN